MNKNTLFIAVSVVAILTGSLSFSSCKRAGEKSAEATENAADQNMDTDNEGKIVTMETEAGTTTVTYGDKSIPADFPKEAPAFPQHEISTTSFTEAPEGNLWSVYYNKVDIKTLDGYRAVLEEAGFKTKYKEMINGGFLSGEKDDLVVSVVLGDGQASHSVLRKK